MQAIQAIQAYGGKVYLKIQDNKYIYFISKQIDSIDLTGYGVMQLKMVSDVVVNVGTKKIIKCRFLLSDIVRYGGVHGTIFGITEEFNEHIEDIINEIGKIHFNEHSLLGQHQADDPLMLDDAATEYATRLAQKDTTFRDRVCEIKDKLIATINHNKHPPQ